MPTPIDYFGHASIITYAQRPFPSVDKMDGELVKLYNSVVAKDDVVYWLGDVSLKPPDKWTQIARILNKMNGTKILVFGNHDDWHWQLYLKAGFQSCHTFLDLTTAQYMPPIMLQRGEGFFSATGVRLCHDPAWAQDKNYLWVCGHLHNCAFTAPSHIAIVSVELTEYRPVLLNDIIDGLRPGEGVLRTEPRPNREPKEWKE